MTIPKPLFNRKSLRYKRDRVAGDKKADFLFDFAAENMSERLGDVKRDFATALILGCRDGILLRTLKKKDRENKAYSSKIKYLVQADIAPQMVMRADRSGPLLAFDEEILPFKEQSFNLILSFMHLHWINDLQGNLRQIYKILKPGGLFLAAFPGGENLAAIRHCLFQAESLLSNRAQMRMIPSVSLHDGAALLQQAGFLLPVADKENLLVHYQNLHAVFTDLRHMGETAHLNRTGFTTPRTLFQTAEALYRKNHSDFSSGTKRVVVNFEIILLHGWKKGV